MSTPTVGEVVTLVVRHMLKEQMPLNDAMTVFEDSYIAEAIKACEGNLTQAAQKLGIHRNTLHNKLRQVRG